MLRKVLIRSRLESSGHPEDTKIRFEGSIVGKSDESQMQSNDHMENDLQNIVKHFDPSVQAKFERCAHNDWCTRHVSREGRKRRDANRVVSRRKSVIRRTLKKLVCMKGKLAKIQKILKKVRSTPYCPPPNYKLDDEITRGSNTPASSRPSSVTLTMDQFPSIRVKDHELQK